MAERAAFSHEADAEQVQRAVLNLMLAGTSELRDTCVDSTILRRDDTAAILVWRRHGLALAVARRLIENQHGNLRAERIADGVQFIIELPSPPQVGETAIPEQLWEESQ